MAGLRETDLYPPVKAFLEAQGYEVKSEIAGADVVACRGDEDPVIVELKTRFSLALLSQGVARQMVTDWVYLAVPRTGGRAGRQVLKNHMTLCRRLGLGLLTVRLADGLVEPRLDPGPYQPRKSKPRQTRLLREFARRVGDPNAGGAARTKIVTAYRQDAMKLRVYLAEHGPSRGGVVAKATAVKAATRILRDNHYGWFERVARGTYGLASAEPTEPTDD